jgi:hypothetical protein
MGSAGRGPGRVLNGLFITAYAGLAVLAAAGCLILAGVL